MLISTLLLPILQLFWGQFSTSLTMLISILLLSKKYLPDSAEIYAELTAEDHSGHQLASQPSPSCMLKAPCGCRNQALRMLKVLPNCHPTATGDLGSTCPEPAPEEAGRGSKPAGSAATSTGRGAEGGHICTEPAQGEAARAPRLAGLA